MFSSNGSQVSDSVPYIEDVFSTYLYTGTGAALTITNGIDLSTYGGLVWEKGRTGAQFNGLMDTVRGVASCLVSSSSGAENTVAATGISAFNSTGYTKNTNGDFNTSTYNYVSWTFRKQSKFFDIVTYTGNATSGRQISHSLGSAPGMIIVKRTDATRSWVCFHRSLGNQGLIKLDTTGAAETASALWYSTTPTSTYFAVNNDVDVNASGGTYVAYLFAHDAGGFGVAGTDNVVSCGTTTPDGSGNFTVNLGYEPQWVLTKTTGASNWNLFDNMRGVTASSGYSSSQRLYTNLTNAEDELSSPYGLGVSATGFTGNTATFATPIIYIAIRRGPMKVPTAATTVFTPVAYFGNGSTQTLSGISGKPTDLFLVSAPYYGVTSNRNYFDRMRGKHLSLGSDNAGNDGTDTNSVLGFDTQSGVRVGSAGAANLNSRYFMSYHFRRAPGFFDIVCWTGTGSYAVRNHNLGVEPELVILKARTTITGDLGWYVYTATQYGFLHQTTAFTSFARSLTSTTFQPVADGSGNYVTYLFATLAGVSKVGTYTGTGTTLQINCGFTAGARFVLIKRTNSTGDWFVYDSTRGIDTGDDPYYFLNNTTAQVTNTDYIDTYSAGFELSSTAPAALNASGGTYIFLAIA